MAAKVSMVELRKDAEGTLRRLRRGQSVILTYRGKAVARLEPIHDAVDGGDDPVFDLEGLAGDEGSDLGNAEIDRIL